MLLGQKSQLFKLADGAPRRVANRGGAAARIFKRLTVRFDLFEAVTFQLFSEFNASSSESQKKK
jgi:hypothetical protein